MRLNIGGRTRWQRVSDAIDAFVRDPRSAGLFVGLQTFPFTINGKPCTNDNDCGFGTGPGTGSYWCARPFVCVNDGATMPAPDAKLCDPNDAFCPGQECVPSGLCSQSGRRCLSIGQACPGGPAGDQCQDAPRVCKFPIDSCEPPDYVRPRVAIAQLPAAAPAMSAGLVAVQPGGNSPFAPALAGAADHLRMHLAGQSGPRAGALVLASDVAPTPCGGGNTGEPGVLQAIQAARNGTPSLPTYVIGAITPGDNVRTEVARQFAQAGGTGMPFVLGNTTADLGDRFLEALAAIRGSALPCQFRIAMPATGTIDYGKVNVRYSRPGGAGRPALRGQRRALRPHARRLVLRCRPGTRHAFHRARLPGHLRPVQGRDGRCGRATLWLPDADRLTATMSRSSGRSERRKFLSSLAAAGLAPLAAAAARAQTAAPPPPRPAKGESAPPAPEPTPEPPRGPPRIRFAVIGVNHPHVHRQVDAVTRGGGQLVAFFAKEPDLAEAFAKRYPQAKLARSEQEILDSDDIQLDRQRRHPRRAGAAGHPGHAGGQGLPGRQARA